MKYPKIPCNKSKKQKLCSMDIKKIKTLEKKGVKKSKIAKQFKVSQTHITFLLSKDQETKLKKIRKYNNDKYHNDSIYREKLKKQVAKNNKERVDNDPKYKKWITIQIKKWHKTHKKHLQEYEKKRSRDPKRIEYQKEWREKNKMRYKR